MVFSSIPVGFYNLDPASNLQQPLHHHQQTLHHGSSSNPNNPSPLLPPPPHPARPIDGPGYLIRPGSMAEKALLENVSTPKLGLECPRCGSTNTKFCYYNNQSLSQPRHLCRNCRRHWTHGGGLRNIPFGGGSRRNKRSKPSSSSSGLASSSMSGVRFSSIRRSLINTPAPLISAGSTNTHEFGVINNYYYGGVNNNYNYSDDEMGSMINGSVEQWPVDQLSSVMLPQFPFPGGLGEVAATAEDGQIMHGAGEENELNI